MIMDCSAPLTRLSALNGILSKEIKSFPVVKVTYLSGPWTMAVCCIKEWVYSKVERNRDMSRVSHSIKMEMYLPATVMAILLFGQEVFFFVFLFYFIYTNVLYIHINV